MSTHFLTSILLSPATWFFFALGACLGSFFNVCIYRIPRKIFWSSSRSKCPHCEHPIPMWHNIPILSWLILRGKAACCKGPISIQYPLVELFTAVLWVIVYWQFPFLLRADGSVLLDSAEFLRFAHAAVFVSLLLICSVIDLQHMIIPDVLSLPMIALSPLVAWIHPELDLKSSLLGVLLGGGVFYAMAWIYVVVRKQYGLGLGDVKLLAAIGGWLGYQSILTTILWSCVLGTIAGVVVMISKKTTDMQSVKVPFGPFISAAAATYLLFGRYLKEHMFPY